MRGQRADDPASFVHIVMFDDPDKSSLIPSLAAFKYFQTQLKQHLVKPPVQERWSVVGSVL